MEVETHTEESYGPLYAAAKGKPAGAAKEARAVRVGSTWYQPEHEPLLLRRCTQGDRRAFDVLWARHRRRVVDYICLRVRDLEEANDLAQEVLIRTWGALSRGTVVTALDSYLYAIARNVISDWANRRGGNLVHPMADIDLIPNDSRSIEERTEARLSWAFLDAQLDKVLVEGEEEPGRRAKGMLRKLAFVTFYVDGLTLSQIQHDLESVAGSMGVPPPTRTQLNNWLSRGDILTKLVAHLVKEHSAWVAESVKECLEQLSLPAQESEIARLRWQDGLPAKEIADRCKLPSPDVSQTLERVTRKLIKRMTKTIKSTLHKSRRKS